MRKTERVNCRLRERETDKQTEKREREREGGREKRERERGEHAGSSQLRGDPNSLRKPHEKSNAICERITKCSAPPSVCTCGGDACEK